MSDPTVQQLRYAVAVADARHFGRAAQACFVSQPSLSAQVRELERRLGVQLFERSTHHVAVTEAGTRVVDTARRALDAVDEVVAVAAGRDDPLAGELRLGVIPTVGPYLLPAAVPALRARWPRLQLHLREERTEVLLDRLAQRELDLAVLALPAGRRGLRELPVGTDEFLLAVPAGHRLAQRSRCDTDELAGERLVLLDDGHCLRDQALQVCHQAGNDGRSQIQGTSLHTVVQMVAGGLGVTLLPALARSVEAGEVTGVRTVRFARPAPSRTIGLVWRDTVPATAAAAYAEVGGELAAVLGSRAGSFRGR